jgi:endo-1,4-beta-xylanase
MQTRGIPAAVIVFGCATILVLGAIVSRAQLRAGADRRGISIGAAVNIAPFRNEPIYTQTLSREFNMLVGENAFKFDATEPANNSFNFTDTDALVSFAMANNMKVRGHTLVWHNQIPGWLLNGAFTRDQVIAIMKNHITRLIQRYSATGAVIAWDVVNEAFNDDGTLRNSFWFQKIGQDYIRMAFNSRVMLIRATPQNSISTISIPKARAPKRMRFSIWSEI